MNLFRRELKYGTNMGLLAVALFVEFFFTFYLIFENERTATFITPFVETFVDPILHLTFGFFAVDMTAMPLTYQLYFIAGLLFSPFYFMMGGFTGVHSILREEVSGSINYLYGKPITRKKLFGSKLFAFMVLFLVCGLLYGLGFFVLGTVEGLALDIDGLLLPLVTAFLYFFIGGLFFWSVGSFSGTKTHQVGSGTLRFIFLALLLGALFLFLPQILTLLTLIGVDITLMPWLIHFFTTGVYFIALIILMAFLTCVFMLLGKGAYEVKNL